MRRAVIRRPTIRRGHPPSRTRALRALRALSLPWLLCALLPTLLPTLLALPVGRAEPAGGPGPAATALEAGHRARRHCDLARARAQYDEVLLRDPLDPAARAGLGEVLLLAGQKEAALLQVELGLGTDRGRHSAALWRVRALVLLELRDVARARAAAIRAAALNPQCPRIQEALARAEYRAGDIAAAQDAYERAVRLDPLAEEANLRLGSGFGELLDEAPWREGALATLFARADEAWQAGRLGEASALFRLLCARAPDVYKFRLGLGLTLRALRWGEEVRLGEGAEDLYRHLPAPEPEGIRRVISGYDDLDEGTRHAVRVAVAPAARWLTALSEAGATHEILPLAVSLAEAEHRRALARQQTFDGRHYAHLRGVGGARAATGVEKLRDAAAFGFHTFAHEFAHQLHHHAFGEALRAEIEALYRQALRSGACLDWYAASNAEEYFAQGYEAFVSPVKRGCLKETQRHTRDELARRDPALYAFLTTHLDLGHETPTAMADFRSRLR